MALFVVYSVDGNSSGSPHGSNHGTTATNHGSTTTTKKPLPVEVGPEQQVVFRNDCAKCSTENFVTGGETAGRSLPTDVWYPVLGSSTTPATSNGSAPLIVLAAGYDLQPNDYLPLIDAWVKAGFVVAAPVFPDTNAAAVAKVLKTYPVPGSDDPHGTPESDVANQPGDLAFVISQLVQDDEAAAAGATAFLHGLFDPSKIGVAGQSDGGDTVAALFYNGCCRADVTAHVGAVAVLSGAENSGWFTGTWFAAAGPPLLVTQGTADACNSPPYSDKIYDSAPSSPAKYFLVLQGAYHLQPYALPGEYSARTAAVTTLFFEVYLGHGSATAAQLLAAGTSAISSITDAAAAPQLAAVPVTWHYDPGTALDPCSMAFTGAPGATTAASSATGSGST